MDESGGQEPAETYPEKKPEKGAEPPVNGQLKSGEAIPKPSKITVVRSQKSSTDLPAMKAPDASGSPASAASAASSASSASAASTSSAASSGSAAVHATLAEIGQPDQTTPASVGPSSDNALAGAGSPGRSPENLSISRQGLKPRPIDVDLPPQRSETKLVLPSPDQPVPLPQAPPQFLGDQGHTRPSDNSLDRSQFGAASHHGGAPIALLTNVNRNKKQTVSPVQPVFNFIKKNLITTTLTLSMVLLASLLFINKEPKLDNVANLDLSILTTGQTLEEVNQLINSKKYEAALSLCDNVIQKDAKFAEAYHARGQVYMAMHRFREAVDDFTTAESFNHRSIDIHIDRAAALYNTQEYDKALREYQQILAAEPNNAAAFFGKGLAEENLGMTEEALDDFKHTLTNRADYGAAYEEMGTIYFAKGDLKKAYENYTNAIKTAPTIPRFYFNRANTLKQDHQIKRAIADYCKAIQLDPSKPEFFNNRGLLYLDNNEVSKAVTDFSSAVDLDPNYTIAKHNLTLAQERLRR
jgi:tetratricopeptide (TPR) repeat protein